MQDRQAGLQGNGQAHRCGQLQTAGALDVLAVQEQHGQFAQRHPFIVVQAPQQRQACEGGAPFTLVDR